MFTGLIETTGTIRSLEDRKGVTRITVAGPASLVQRLHAGDSVAVSGVCLTAVDINPDSSLFAADLAAETIARTSLSRLHSGSIVNLELPTEAGTPLGGHIVQGHVDGVGTVQSLQPLVAGAQNSATDWWLRLTIPEECAAMSSRKVRLRLKASASPSLESQEMPSPSRSFRILIQ